MVQGEGFKHISVTAAEEDDVVIVAGLKDRDDEGRETPAPADEPEPEPESELEPDPVPASRPKPASRPSKEDAYREATLADLERTPMPFAQRVVIVAAIICIIGAVIYCFAFMG